MPQVVSVEDSTGVMHASRGRVFPASDKLLSETAGGFHRSIAARKRPWNTETHKANFIVPTCLDADPDMVAPDPEGSGILRLMTIRSNDQFNITIYGYNDNFRGIHGTRSVVLLGEGDMERLGLSEGDIVNASTVADDAPRTVYGLRVVHYEIPQGCAAAYYPECNALIPLWHHAKGSCVSAAKSIPIRLQRATDPRVGAHPSEQPSP